MNLRGLASVTLLVTFAILVLEVASQTAKPTKTDKSSKSKPESSPKCPDNCACINDTIDCSSRSLKTIPAGLKSLKTAKEIILRNNSIQEIDFSQFPTDQVRKIDLSSNRISNITLQSNSSILSNVDSINLANNKLTSWDNLTSLKFNSLSRLNVSGNVLRNLKPLSATKLKILDLSKNQLQSLDEDSFASMKTLETLNLTSAGNLSYLPDKLFAMNEQLEILLLDDLGLVEVPAALRPIRTKFGKLTLNGNQMTSLRQSDFHNISSLEHLEIQRCPKLTKVDELTFSDMKLRRLIISQNPRLNHFSKDTFKSELNLTIDKLDLSSNNLTTLGNLFEDSSLVIEFLELDGNPWNCDCALNWLSNIPVENRSLVHCKSPEVFRDKLLMPMMILDCDTIESNPYQLIFAIVSLIVLAVIIIFLVKKSQLIRRFFWKDQYGSIYYTKASFPLEPT